MSRASLLLLLALAACDFDDAYRKYCEGNPACAEPPGDAGGIPDAGASAPDAAGLAFPTSCARPTDCAPSEVCHPRGRVCVPSCETAATCPTGLDTCAPQQGPHGETTPPVCGCSTAQSCAQAFAGSTCNPLDNLCEPLCQKDQDCAGFDPPRTCDEVSGLCLQGPTSCTANTDCASATQPRCDQGMGRCTKCFSPDDCAQRTDGLLDCDPGTGACVAFSACNGALHAPGENGGPDVCRYGQDCVASVCAPVPRGSCHGAVYTPWDQRDRGPVILEAEGRSATSHEGECRLGDPMITAKVRFYAPKGFTWFNPVTFMNPTGGGPDGGRLDADFIVNPPEDGATWGDFVVGLCGFSGFAGWSVQLTDDAGNDGNTVCLE